MTPEHDDHDLADCSPGKLHALLDEDDLKWQAALPNPDRSCAGHTFRPENLDLMPTERRWAITHELWLRSMLVHERARALDVEDTEPVEVLSYIDGDGYEARVWSYLEQVELPQWYGILRGAAQPDHPRVYRDRREVARRNGEPIKPPQHPDLTFPPALRRPNRVRIDGRDLDRAWVLERRRKRAALIRLLRE